MAGIGFSLGATGGARAVTGSGAMDAGYSSPTTPGLMSMGGGSTSLAAQGTTWVVVGAAVWLAIMYLHFHTY